MNINEAIKQISANTTASNLNNLLTTLPKSRENLSDLFSALRPTQSHLLPVLIKWYGATQAVGDLYIYPSEWSNDLEPLLEAWSPQQLLQNFAQYGHIGTSIVNKLISKGANIEQITFNEYSSINSEAAELLLNLGYNKFTVLKLLLQNHDISHNKDEADKTLALLQKTVITSQDKAQFGHIALSSGCVCPLSQEYVSLLLSFGLPPEKLLLSLITKHYYARNEPDLTTIAKLTSFLVQNGANVLKAFSQLDPFDAHHMSTDMASILLDNGLSPNDFLSALLYHTHTFANSGSSGTDEPSYEEKNYIEASVRLALARGADVNYQPQGQQETILERLIKNNHPLDWELIDEVITLCNEKKISVGSYGEAVIESLGYLEDAIGIVKRFGHLYSKDEITDYARAAGVSLLEISLFFDFFKLCEEYIKYQKGEPALLSEIEIAILDRSVQALPTESYKGPLNNPSGFSPLQLALIAGRYKLALNMLEAGFDYNTPNVNGLTALTFTSYIDSHHPTLKAIFEYILEHSENIDVINIWGENIVDIFLRHSELKDRVLEKSNDPVYACFKQNSMTPCSLTDPDKIYIGISHGENFWSSGVQAVARLIMRDFPEVEFRVVTMEKAKSGGENLIKHFSGWINPGGGDSYPQGKTEFTKVDWLQDLDTEQLYQYILNTTRTLGIPTLGMCAGAQNLVLNNDGYLYPLKEYCGGKQHYISYLEGTLAHFKAMSPAQQTKALKMCEFPDITFAGDTAHNYAGVYGKLGHNIVLGAISEDRVPMSYCTDDGLHCATQFHPEHHYHYPDSPEQVNHEKAWLTHFVHLAKMYHDFNQGNGLHPKEYLHTVQENLSFCLDYEMCPA